MVVRARKSDRTTPRPEEESGAEPRPPAKSRQPKAASRKPPAESRQPKAASREPRAARPKAESQERARGPTTESFPGKKKLNSAEQKLTPLTQC